MKKSTILQIKSLKGANITVTIDRAYGNETVMVNADGDKVATKQFIDYCLVTVAVDTKYGKVVLTNPSITDDAQLGKVICDNTTIQGKRVAIKIQISGEDYNAIINTKTERLTEDIDPEVAARIEQAKQCELHNLVLPSAELGDKRRRYNEAFNEGGFGWTPYDNYMTTEEVMMLKKTYPEQF